jgi:thiamine-monophosphate kinase
VDEHFLDGFSRGLHALADEHGIELVGGDTTAGPLAVGITVFGEVPPGQALLRGGARAGDRLWVSGTLGDARLALEVFRGRFMLPGEDFERVRAAMEQPTPRVALGVGLRGVASAAIDLSDGLVGDLGHVLAASRLGATLRVDALPRSAVLAAQSTDWQRLCTLAGGDDYELLFAAPPSHDDAVRAAGERAGVALTCIGELHQVAGLTLLDADRRVLNAAPYAGFDHFA